MSRRIRIRPRASLDLDDHFLYIAERRPKAAIGFLDTAEAAFALLVEQPSLGAPYPLENDRLQGLRMWPLRRFHQHLIF